MQSVKVSHTNQDMFDKKNGWQREIKGRTETRVKTFTTKSWTEIASLDEDSAAPIFGSSNVQMFSWTRRWRKDCL